MASNKASSSLRFESHDGQCTIGNARFTVLTPYCIRLEYSEQFRFIDDPSLVVINRESRYTEATIQRDVNKIIVDTVKIHLTYAPDGKPFHAGNLHAEIRMDENKIARWEPGMASTGNLGGTIPTVDQVAGPVSLGEGILSRDGWYLLDDSRSPLMTKTWVKARPPDAGTDWYLLGYGTDYRSALQSFTTIAGKIPLPRKYVLGVWYSRYWPYTSEEFRSIVNEYKEHDFPLDCIVLDMDWHRKGWTGWSWNRELLPDAEELLQWFHEKGLAVTLNVHPADGVAPHEDMYKEFMHDMGEDPTTTKTIPYDAGDKKYLDTLFKHTHIPRENEGVDFWWLDWQQYPNTRSIPELKNLAWLNHYYFHHTGRDGNRGQSFSRWGGWGSHRYPISFSGDADTGWEMLKFEIPFTATAGNVGCFFWSHDIGGHWGARNEESYARWCQFGSVSAALRSHSTRDADKDRRPWTYPRWAEDSMRRSFHLRSELFPYIYSSIRQACRDSVSFTRPMYIDYPEHEKAYQNPQQYLFGDAMLAAPIVSPGIGPGRVARQVVWFPEGTWYNFFTSEKYEGESEVIVTSDINEFPLYVRGGIPIPMQPYRPRMTTAGLEHVIVKCFSGEDGTTGSSVLYEDDGITTGYQKGAYATTQMNFLRNGKRVRIEIEAACGTYKGQVASRSYTIELPCTLPAHNVAINGTSATADYDAEEYINRITVPSIPVNCACIIEADVDSANSAIFHQRALIRRVQGITGKPCVASDTVSKIITASLKNRSQTIAQRDMLLSTTGIGIVLKNEGLYYYQGRETFYFYARSGIIDGNKANVGITKGAGKKRLEIFEKKCRIETSAERIPLTLPEYNCFEMTGYAAFSINRKRFKIQESKFNISSDENLMAQAKAQSKSVQKDKDKKETDGILEIKWSEPQMIDAIWLLRKPNSKFHITSARVKLSRGKEHTFKEFPNSMHKPAVVRFHPQKVKEMSIRVSATGPWKNFSDIADIAVTGADAGDSLKNKSYIIHKNPVWSDDLADPFVLKHNNEYWAYGTSGYPGLKGKNERIFPVLHSRDFISWEYIGCALEPPFPGLKKGAYWAPEVVEHNSKFYMYFSCADIAGDEFQRLYVAVADNPAGPFTTVAPLLPNEGFTIDAHPFRDPLEGRWYLFFAKDYFEGRTGTGLAAVQLDDSMTSTTGPVVPILQPFADWQIFERNRLLYGRRWKAWHTIEGACVVYHNEKYWCFYSGGAWKSAEYGVGCAVSDKALGPYTDIWSLEQPNVLRTIPGKSIGPGHNSVVVGPDNNTHYIVYHSWDKDHTARRMCISPLEWTEMGPRVVQHE